MRPREIHVQIGELILHGVAPHDASGVGEAAKRELTRLFVEGGVSDALMRTSAIDSIDAEAVARPRQSMPGQFGTELAGTIYRGMSR